MPLRLKGILFADSLLDSAIAWGLDAAQPGGPMFSLLWFLLVVPGLPLGLLMAWIHATAKKRERQFRRPFD